MERIAVVNENGILKKFTPKKQLANGDILAVELVLVYLPTEKKLVLFNRGDGASDMRYHWALESGKVIQDDLANQDQIDRPLSIDSYVNAAVREFKEELNFPISPTMLELVDQFFMPHKNIFFTLFSVPLENSDLIKLIPDQSEIDKLKKFSIEEFAADPNLGDAIRFRKEHIIQHLEEKFNTIEWHNY